MERINEKIKKYKESINLIASKRDLWRSVTKDFLYNHLLKIKNIDRLDWYVGKNEYCSNNESVYLSFGKSFSGIVMQNGESKKAYTKYGGALLFSQSYNGDIFVFISFPYVEEIIPERDVLLLEKTSPEKIDEEYINNKVERFFDEIISWESSDSFNINKLGFKYE